MTFPIDIEAASPSDTKPNQRSTSPSAPISSDKTATEGQAPIEFANPTAVKSVDDGVITAVQGSEVHQHPSNQDQTGEANVVEHQPPGTLDKVSCLQEHSDDKQSVPAAGSGEGSSEDEESDSSGTSLVSSLIHYANSRVVRDLPASTLRKRYKQHATYMSLMEQRLQFLESKLSDLTKLSPRPASSRQPTVRKIAAIPELHFLDWDAFKASKDICYQEDQVRYAVDVLVGEPVLFHQQYMNARTIHEGPPGEQPDESTSENANLPMSSIPDRIRINSKPLQAVLRNFLRGPFRQTSDTRSLVILRPYRPLMYHEKDLRSTLRELEKTWLERPDQESLEPESQSDSENLGHESDETSSRKSDGQDTSLHESKDAMNELRCLLRFVSAIKPLIADIQRAPSIDKMSRPGKAELFFKDLVYLFHPGQYVFRKSGMQQVWRVIQTKGGRNLLSTGGPEPGSRGWNAAKDSSRMLKTLPFMLEAYYIDFDGIAFGPVHEWFTIHDFDGSRLVTELDIYPLVHVPNHQELLKTLARRGAEFRDATQVVHKYFRGRTLVRSPKGDKLVKDKDVLYPEDVESPVMIDFDRALQFNPEWSPHFGLAGPATQDVREVREMTLDPKDRPHRQPTSPADAKLDILPFHAPGESCFTTGCCDNEEILADHFWERKIMDDFISKDQLFWGPSLRTEKFVVSQEQEVLFPDRVFGFILRTRKWACMPLSCLKDIVKSPMGFNALELAGTHKEIVTGLVNTHFQGREKGRQTTKARADESIGFDLVRAKGKGLIILLHGAPGVGKTSTAECIAESHGQPLFPITCGDLGVDPIDVEKGLEFNFQLAESWGCVLLLDEADVFLAQREKNDLTRNALVSVFLRALEYYSGILFLTTNRVGAIDEAFRSRIHMSLSYPILSEQQTLKIWDGHLVRLQERFPNMDFNKQDIIRYAKDLFDTQVSRRKVGWNGRQIRNAMKTAIALAEYDSFVKSGEYKTEIRPSLDIKWFEVVAKASWEFDEYLEKALELTNLEYAKMHGMRDDQAHHDHKSMALPLNPSFSGTSFGWQNSQQQKQQQQHSTPQPNMYGQPSVPQGTTYSSHQYAPAQTGSLFGSGAVPGQHNAADQGQFFPGQPQQPQPASNFSGPYPQPGASASMPQSFGGTQAVPTPAHMQGQSFPPQQYAQQQMPGQYQQPVNPGMQAYPMFPGYVLPQAGNLGGFSMQGSASAGETSGAGQLPKPPGQ